MFLAAPKQCLGCMDATLVAIAGVRKDDEILAPLAAERCCGRERIVTTSAALSAGCEVDFADAACFACCA